MLHHATLCRVNVVVHVWLVYAEVGAEEPSAPQPASVPETGDLGAPALEQDWAEARQAALEQADSAAEQSNQANQARSASFLLAHKTSLLQFQMIELARNLLQAVLICRVDWQQRKHPRTCRWVDTSPKVDVACHAPVCGWHGQCCWGCARPWLGSARC